MMDTPTSKSLEDTLAEIEARTEPLSEHEVSDAIRRLRDKDDPSPRPMEWLAEVMAFDFCENYQNKETGWGTYFGPMMAGTSEDGSRWESPPIKLVTSEMLGYWAKRAREAKNPILKARYAGLVWDFTNPVTGKSPPVEMAWMRIDNIIEAVASGSHKYEMEAIKKLEHALQLAVSLNDAARVERVRDAILAYEDKVAQDDKPGLWCFTFDFLWGKKNVPLTDAQKTKIIKDLEGRLDRVSDTSGNNSLEPWAAEAAAVRLAKHYRSEGRSEEVKRVLLKYGAAFEKIAEPAAAMLAQAWLEKVYQVYRDFGLKEDAERLLRRIRELGPKALGDLKPISVEMKITNEEMAGYVKEMTEGDLETVLGKVARRYLPRRDQIETQIKDLAATAPLSFLFQAQLIDHKGRPTATVGSLEHDLEGRVIMQMAQDIQFVAVFLRQVMIALVNKFAITHEVLTEYVCRTPLFDEDSRAILGRGIKAYLEGDSLVAIHVLMPQIENAIRTLVENTGGTVLKPNQFGGMDTKTFNELLRHEKLSAVFGDDVPLYLRVLFTDRRGVNLRNRVFHGIAPASTFNLTFADMVVHSLLILAQVRKKEEPAADEREGGKGTK